MKIPKREHYLSRNELDCFLVKSVHFIKVVVYVTTRHILQEKVDTEFVLKNVVHRVYKWVFRLEQNFLFDLDVLDLIFLQYYIFV